MRVEKSVISFEWDSGNIGKNKKHKVEDREIEEVFFDPYKVTFSDEIHPANEERFRIIGKTKKDRLLFVVFTKRNGRVRIISARDLNRREVSLYEKSA